MRSRILAALALGVALWAALAGWTRDVRAANFEDLQVYEAPERVDGHDVVLSLVTVVAVDRAGFEVSKGPWRFHVQGEAPVRVGQEGYVLGTYQHEQRRVELREWIPAEGRRSKKILGLVGLAVTGVLLPLGFGIRREGVFLRG